MNLFSLASFGVKRSSVPTVSSAFDWDAEKTAAIAARTKAGATTRYADPLNTTGAASNANAGTSRAAPKLNIGNAITASAAGDVVIVIGSGNITGTANWISENQCTIPSGLSDAQRTIIRAETPFGPRLMMSAAPSVYGDGPVCVLTKDYLLIDGICAESDFTASTTDGNDAYLFKLYGTHNILSRAIGKRKSVDQYGGIFAYADVVNYNVLEDCHGVGSSRYMFYGGTGGLSTACGNTVLRRCTGYMPFGPVFEPTAIFTFYGSDTPSYASVANVLLANCFTIDSPHIPKKPVELAEDLKWADFYFPKSIRNMVMRGCGVINSGGAYAAVRFDNVYSGTDLVGTITDCAVSGYNNGSPATAQAIDKPVGAGNLTITNLTARDIPSATFVPTDQTTSTNNQLGGAIVSPARRVSGNGSEILYAHGATFAAWGDTGYDTVQTSMRLWPFPYEAEIKAVWGEAITRVTQDEPSAVATSANPATGTSMDGSAQSFTKRFWESAGTQMPAYSSIY